METYITICKIDRQWQFAVWLRKLKQWLCISLEGRNGEGGGSVVRLWWSGWGRLWMFRQWWWLGSWNTGPWSKSICKRQSGWFHVIVAQMDQEWARTSFGKSFTTQKQMEPLSQTTIYQQRLRGGRFWRRRICYDASGCRPEPGFKHIRVL